MRRLVVQLRWLKDRSELSLSSLQSKTGYSRSSWERYLNGRALPPREAVEALARVAGADPTRPLALHEVAAEAWQQDTDDSDAHDSGTDDSGTADVPDPPRPRGRRRAVLIGVCSAVALAAVLVALLVAPWRDGGDDSRKSFVYQPGKTYPCPVKRENGRLYAGYSTTSTAVLSGPGWDVVEAQCLLRHRGFDPGGVDGVYGQNTTRAVKRLQDRTGLTPDGVVGPNTWRVLRK